MTRAMMMTMAACVCAMAATAAAGVLSVPADYTADKAWPVIVSTQSNPAPALMKKTPYFLVHAGGQGMQATKKIRAELIKLAGRYNIDPMRIYGTGFSRGGQEVLIQAWQFPHWFAAIAPVCNDLRRKPDRNERDDNVRYLVNVPTLLIHGDHDSFRETGEILFKRMKDAKCPVTWKTYPGGHSADMPFRKNVKLLTDFFEKHKLNPYPKKIVHLVEHKRYSRAFWADATLVKDVGDIKAVFTVEVGKDNRIEVTGNEHIAALDLHLSDKVVDMKKPVTVVAGKKQLYKGPAKAKLTVKLRDGQPYTKTPVKPLWQEIQEIRAKAAASKPATSKPAKAPAVLRLRARSEAPAARD